jgi:sigma-B regulation protein RsbU (phosphoserine phosphatase)
MSTPKSWEQRLEHIVEMMRAMSLQTDPDAMVRDYGARLRQILPSQDFMAISRRGLESPQYRITRSSRWKEPINPWEQKEQLPLHSGGILSGLIYANQPRILNDFRVDSADPAAEFLQDARSLMAIPHFDRGESLNMVIVLRESPEAFDPEAFPEMVQMSSLFGRATYNLHLLKQLSEANEQLERELRIVANLQRSLLPRKLPAVPGLELSAHYRTSRHAGGDYYDVFARPDGGWGLFIADVSGHGAPAAVLMAVTHSLAHTIPYPPDGPAALLHYLNDHLTELYTQGQRDVRDGLPRHLRAPKRAASATPSAGHNPPRLLRGKRVTPLDNVGGMPLGIYPQQNLHRLRDDPGVGGIRS